jgi:hypothetical protein
MTESELLDRALVRLALLIASEDDRIAMRACKEVFDRVLGRPSQRWTEEAVTERGAAQRPRQRRLERSSRFSLRAVHASWPYTANLDRDTRPPPWCLRA